MTRATQLLHWRCNCQHSSDREIASAQFGEEVVGLACFALPLIPLIEGDTYDLPTQPPPPTPHPEQSSQHTPALLAAVRHRTDRKPFHTRKCVCARLRACAFRRVFVHLQLSDDLIALLFEQHTLEESRRVQHESWRCVRLPALAPPATRQSAK